MATVFIIRNDVQWFICAVNTMPGLYVDDKQQYIDSTSTGVFSTFLLCLVGSDKILTMVSKFQKSLPMIFNGIFLINKFLLFRCFDGRTKNHHWKLISSSRKNLLIKILTFTFQKLFLDCWILIYPLHYREVWNPFTTSILPCLD